MKTAVAYTRFSSDNQREESIDAQKRQINAYAKLHNITILETYVDEAKSATTDNRPAFLKMINEVKDIDYVIVHKLDRFARNRYDSAIYRNKLKKKGIKVVSVLENLDDSPESVILESVLEGMNEYYSLNLAREVKKGHNENAYKALHNGGTPPLGFDVTQEKTYVINEFEAEAVKIIFNMYADGYGYSDIRNEMNRLGFKTKSGNEFGKNSLYEILRNRKYIGDYIYNRRKRDGNKYNNHADSDEMIVLSGAIPQIIDKNVWSRVEMRRIENKKRRGAHMSRRDYLLSGKVYHECGSVMRGTKKSSKKGTEMFYYRCENRDCHTLPKSIQTHVIEDKVIKALNNYIFIEDKIKLADKIYENINISSSDDEYLKLKNKLSELIKEEKNITNAVLSGIINEELKTKNNDIQKQKAFIEHELKSLGTEDNISLDDVKEFISSVGDLTKYDKEEQKKIVDQFVYKILLSPTRIRILLYKNPLDVGRCYGRGERI